MNLLKCFVLLFILNPIDGQIKRRKISDDVFRSTIQSTQTTLGCGIQHELCYAPEKSCFTLDDDNASACIKTCELCMACVHLERGSIIHLCRPHNVICCKSGDCTKFSPCSEIYYDTEDQF